MSGQLKATASQEFTEKKTEGREQREERTGSKAKKNKSQPGVKKSAKKEP